MGSAYKVLISIFFSQDCFVKYIAMKMQVSDAALGAVM